MKNALLLFFIVTCQTTLAQQGYTFNRISTDDASGLSSNIVYCTYHDKKGFIWLGTANGLQRFDGSKFITFGSGSGLDNSRLPVAELNQVLPGDDGTLVLHFGGRQEIGLFNPTTFSYKTITIKSKANWPSRVENFLWYDQSGNLYLSVWKYGILKYDKATNCFCDNNPFNLPKGYIPYKHIYEDTLTKRFWIPCPDSGLLVYDQKTKQCYTKNFNPKKIPLLNNHEIAAGVSEFFIDSKRRHWVFYWTGEQNKRCFNEQGVSLTDTAGINSNKQYSELRHFFETREGVVWVYGSNGLFNYDNNFRNFYFYKPGFTNLTSINYREVNHITEDRDGSIWLSTDNGLFYSMPGAGTFGVVNTFFNEDEGGTETTDLLELASGQLWISTWGSGIITLNQNFKPYNAGIYKNLPGTPVGNQYRQVWALHQLTNGKIFIGCQASKYMMFDTASGTTFYSEIKEAEGATLRYITSARNGTVWISTQRGHIIKYDGKQFTVVQKLNTIVPKILVDNKGYLWLATLNQGLVCLSPDGKTIIRRYSSNSGQNRLFINSGNDIDQINDSTIAYGAGALNLVNTNTGKVTWVTYNDGLPGNSIQRIRADKNNNLWIITFNGLCKYNPVTRHFTPYDRKDGMALGNITRSADLLSRKGYILFTGANALMLFDPNVFENKKPPPAVEITDFKLFNQFLPIDSVLALHRVKLRSGQNSFSIYFAGLSYAQKGKLAYFYKLEGVDKFWVKTDKQLFANYALLPPGNYTFKVYCENIEGIRSPNVASITFYIKPPFYKTWWFNSSLVFVILLFLYTLHWLRLTRLLAVEKLRNKVARDLHDDMGSTLSTIHILSSMAKSKLNTDPVKTSDFISKISENSQRMMEAMDDIVWSIKPSNDSMQKITARMREFATSVLEARDMEAVFAIDDAVYTIKLNMEARRDFFLVFKEAINNAAKYSKATRVEIMVKAQTNYLVMSISDNGVGFDVKSADTGNGMGNMRKRTENMNGRLKIDSKPLKGTSVQVSIPFN